MTFQTNLEIAKSTTYLYLLFVTGAKNSDIGKVIAKTSEKMFMDYAYEEVCSSIQTDPVLIDLLGQVQNEFSDELTAKILEKAMSALQKTISIFRNGITA